jgi:tRNA(fMet)-specific endonuclease VapC
MVVNGLILVTGEIGLDSTSVIDFFRGRPGIGEKMQNARRLYLPAPALGELYHGALKSDYPEKNLRQLLGFLSTVELLIVDAPTAQIYGEIKNRLERQGERIPENDMWIGASCLRHGYPLACRDAHFDRIEGLITIKW